MRLIDLELLRIQLLYSLRIYYIPYCIVIKPFDWVLPYSFSKFDQGSYDSYSLTIGCVIFYGHYLNKRGREQRVYIKELRKNK